MHWDVLNQLEDGAGNIVPRRAKQDDGLAREVFHVLAVGYIKAELSQC